MKPTRKHKTSAAKSTKEEHGLREAFRRQSQELGMKNRELEIEASLERVRSRAMAMQSSSELGGLIAMIHDEIGRLDKDLDRSFIMLFNDDGSSTWWMKGNEKMTIDRGYNLPYHKHSPYLACLQGWRKQERIWRYVLKGSVKKKWDDFIFNKTELAQLPKKVKSNMAGAKVAHWSSSFNKYGCISTGSFAEPSSFDLMVRFSRMFEQTYTRFLDLKKAEAQAREAQVQLALERVRARTMAMQKSEELNDVAVLLFQQVEQLGIKAWTTGFNVWSDDGNFYTDYVTSPKGNLIEAYTIDAREFHVFKAVADARRSGTDFWMSYLEGEVLQETYRELTKYGEEGQYDKMLQDGFQFPSQQYNHFVFGSNSNVSSMFITYDPVPEAHDIFKRFGKVFEQTYTRFLDLQKAEAQTREAQIQLALERLRARTMAMHYTLELSEVAEVLFTQLRDLGAKLCGCGFNICKADDAYVERWMCRPDGKMMDPLLIPISIGPFEQLMYNAWKDGTELITYEQSGAELQEEFESLRLHPSTEIIYKRVIELTVANIVPAPTLLKHYVASYKYGYLWVMATEEFEETQVFIRFAKVFEQTYTRFLDLKKAELQTREAQIEAALERVRSRTMAMHKSEELLEVITVVCEQLQQVGVKFSSVSFGKNSSSFDMDFWGAAPDLKTPIRLYAPYAKMPIYERLKKAHREKKILLTDTFTAEETKVWYEHLIDHNPKMFNEKSREYLLSRPGMTRTGVLLKNVILFAINNHPTPCSDEENEILIRFANVFDQTYTRFLDLQKAEGQAREAQIEAALEKVRARTMGMQRSEELAEVAVLMFLQVKSFGLKSWGCGFNIWKPGDQKFVGWMSSPDGNLVPPSIISLTEHPYFRRFAESREKGIDFFAVERRGEELEEFYNYLMNQPVVGEGLREFIDKTGTPHPTLQIDHIVNFSHGNLIFITYEPCPEAHDIFKRFTKVFEQTYTRFLDLQKSEAQARESQIQLALERVRARTMAMHHSNEVRDVAQTLSDQMLQLGFEGRGCTVVLVNAGTGDMEWWTGGFVGSRFDQSFFIRNFDHPVHSGMVDGFIRGEKFRAFTLSGEFKKSYDDGLFIGNGFQDVPADVQEWMRSLESAVFSVAYNKHGALHWGPAPITEEQASILQRFASVFEQTYTRFLDLQKAESLARESQIELGLERVRARAMAMQKSVELNELIGTVSSEIGKLDIVLDRSFIVTYDIQTLGCTWWMSNPETPSEGMGLYVKYNDFPPYLEHIQAWKDRRLKWQYVLEGEVKKSWDKFLFVETELSLLPPEVIAAMRSNEKVFLSSSFNNFGCVSLATLEPLSEEQFDILLRFAKVFDLTYTRFNDLKQAEAQTREAQIEVALERVRARAMAMHTAQELSDVVHELRKQMGLLGQKDLETCGIHLNDESPEFIQAWAGSRLANRNDEILESQLMIPKRGLSVIEEIVEAYSSNRKDYVITIDSEKLQEWMEFMRGAAPKAYSIIVESTKNSGQEHKPAYWSLADFQGGSLLMVTLAQPEEASRALLRRFSNVFGLAYRRFSDLKQAEVQAREAQIEAALERVRASAMAMHSTHQLKEVVHELRKQIGSLGDEYIDTVAIHLNDESPDFVRAWAGSRLAGRDEVKEFMIEFPKKGIAVIEEALEFYNQGKRDYQLVFDHEKTKSWWQYIFEKLPEAYEFFSGTPAADVSLRHFMSFADFQGGSLLMTTLKQPGQDDLSLLRRFSNVFGLAYRRFADLTQAEAQAREAQVEAALERVRSRTMAMRQSSELSDVASLLFKQVSELGIKGWTAGFNVWSDDNNSYTDYVVDPQGGIMEPYVVDATQFSVFIEIGEARKSGHEFFVQYVEGERLIQGYEHLSRFADKGQFQKILSGGNAFPAKQYDHFVFGSKVSLMFITYAPVPEFHDVFKRFGKVFEQTYTRFLDLQKAEVHAKEAVRQASLDRIRAEIASMRTVEDLDRITPLIWSELTTLNIPFIRCGVFIVDELIQNVRSFLSTPDGQAIAVFQLPFDTPGLVGDILKNWEAKKMYVNLLDDRAMKSFADILVDRGIFKSVEQYLSTAPKGGFYQHLLPFRQGMLYVGNLTQLREEDLTTLQSLADAFSTAYARYDDFKKLEEAKLQVDNALVNLKQAQQQLVQSEKMASLGELTAGIAHEIQNPLNFVNNFSEVSHELMDEMKAEIEAGNVQAAAELLESIKQNLEKITHHGKRADGIVKGMLQHSRSGSGQKEPTNLNVLCDEYVRLAYHGYRAKDKSFNAKFETDFDSNLPKVNVIAQDIGRVILNLINNAFYAVNEKSAYAKASADKATYAKATADESTYAKGSADESTYAKGSADESTSAKGSADKSSFAKASADKSKDYTPSVMISTKKLNDKIEISVRDNGNGIPEAIREKIFQPFFSTKPTGQGTGLGLSLSYDIVKAHGGTLSVNSKKGEGSEFIVQLPQ